MMRKTDSDVEKCNYSVGLPLAALTVIKSIEPGGKIPSAKPI